MCKFAQKGFEYHYLDIDVMFIDVVNIMDKDRFERHFRTSTAEYSIKTVKTLYSEMVLSFGCCCTTEAEANSLDF